MTLPSVIRSCSRAGHIETRVLPGRRTRPVTVPETWWSLHTPTCIGTAKHVPLCRRYYARRISYRATERDSSTGACVEFAGFPALSSVGNNIRNSPTHACVYARHMSPRRSGYDDDISPPGRWIPYEHPLFPVTDRSSESVQELTPLHYTGWVDCRNLPGNRPR